jgi:ethanolamine utilization cobalamin adenosyltransferase
VKLGKTLLIQSLRGRELLDEKDLNLKYLDEYKKLKTELVNNNENEQSTSQSKTIFYKNENFG